MIMPKKHSKLWGLISYKPRWGLSISGWLGVISMLACLFWLLLFRLEPFLAYSAPVKADVLVVEGWIADEGIMGAIDEFERQPYKLLITAGSPFGRGEYLSEYRDFANLAKATMVSLGLEPQKIQPITTPEVIRDRTLTSASAVKQWLTQSKLNPQRINVYTLDVHSRRTWLLYRKVFEPEISVGIISHPALDYDPDAWWTSSEGFRKVFSEAIAYLYAKFL
jgi:hypothetical protein